MASPTMIDMAGFHVEACVLEDTLQASPCLTGLCLDPIDISNFFKDILKDLKS